MTQLKIIENKLSKYDWTHLDPELFRGPELSFPIKIDLLMAPMFNATVISAVDSFEQHFLGSYLDPEYEGFLPIIMDQIADIDGFTRTLTERDLGLRMHYICGTIRVLLLSLGQSEDTETIH